MNAVEILGHIARTARQLRLGGRLEQIRDRLDDAFVKAGRLPLRRHEGDLELGGLFRHRSYLASLDCGYERFSRELFVAALAPGTVVVDGGAHIGLFSQLALRSEPELAGMLAFEPDPFNFAALRLNVPVEDAPLVRLENKALGDSAGHAQFNVSSGTISSSLYERPDVGGPWTKTRVEVTALDDELRGIAHARLLIKLDLEGAEPAALRGLAGTFGTVDDVVLLVEANASALSRAGHSVRDLLDTLENAGLESYRVEDGTRRLRAGPDPQTMPKGNLIAARGEFAKQIRGWA